MKTSLKAICDYAFLAQGGKLSIIGIFENVNVQQLPSVHPSMCFVLSLEDGKPGQLVEYSFNIEDPDGQIVVDKSNAKAKAEIGANGKLNLILSVIGVPIKKSGMHKVNIFAGDFKDSLEFNAKQLPQGRA